MKPPVTPATQDVCVTPMAVGTDTTLTPGTAQNHQGGHGSVSSVAISSSQLLGSATKPKPRATPVSISRFLWPSSLDRSSPSYESGTSVTSISHLGAPLNTHNFFLLIYFS